MRRQRSCSYAARSSLMASPPTITSKTTDRATRRTRRSGKAEVSDGPAGSPAPSRGGVVACALPPSRNARSTPLPIRGPVPGATSLADVSVAPETVEVLAGPDSAVIVARVRIRRSMRLLSTAETPLARRRRISAFKKRSRRARSRIDADASACSSRRRFAETFRPSSIRSRSFSSGRGNRSNLLRNVFPGEGRARVVPESRAAPAESSTEPGWGRSLRVSSVVSTTPLTGSGVVTVTLCAPMLGTTNANGTKANRKMCHFIRQPRVDPR
jgi:hypothetical protein